MRKERTYESLETVERSTLCLAGSSSTNLSISRKERQNTKLKVRGKREKGITLIALVGTIVVLLILAGVTVTVLFGDNGIFGTAENATTKFGIEAEREKINNVLIDWWTKKVTGENVTVEDFFKMLQPDIVGDRSDITDPDDNNTYIVETNNGYTVEIIVDEKGNIQIGDIEKGNLSPKIRDIKISTTENSITAKAIVARAEGKTVTYEYKLETEADSSYKPMTANADDSYTATGLTANASYSIRVRINPTDPQVEEIRTAIAREQEADWALIGRIAKHIATRTDITINEDTQSVSGRTAEGDNYSIKVGDTFMVRYNNEAMLREVRVLGFKHDELADKTVYRNNAQDTRTWEKAGISFEFVDFLTDTTWKYMNTSATNTNGWAATEMREYLNGYNSKTTDSSKIGVQGGEAVKLSNSSEIKKVKKAYLPNYNSEDLSEEAAEDYLWLLACGEIWSDGYNGEKTRGYARNSEGSQYKYYKNAQVTDSKTYKFSDSNPALVKEAKSTASANVWWLRSPGFGNSSCFCYVSSSGYCGSGFASGSRGVTPGFSI